MLKNICLVAILGLSLAACSEDKETMGPTQDLTSQEVTDLSSCKGRTPVDTNLYSTKWTSRTRYSNGGTLDKTFDFNQGSVILTGTGALRGERDRITVRSNFSEAGKNRLRIDGSETVLKSVRAGDEVFHFGLRLPANTMTYSFKGPCLVINIGTTDLTLVPVRH